MTDKDSLEATGYDALAVDAEWLEAEAETRNRLRGGSDG